MKEPTRASRMVSPTKLTPNKSNVSEKRNDGTVSPISYLTNSTDQSSTRTQKDEPMPPIKRDISQEILMMKEEDIEEMTLTELQDIAQRWKSQFNMEKFKVSAYKRLELQLKVEQWQKDTIRDNKIKECQNAIQESNFQEILQISNESDINQYDKKFLVNFLYFFSGGTDIKNLGELFSQSTQFICERVFKAVTYHRKHENEMVSIEDSIGYIQMSDIEENESEEIAFIQMHARNWIQHTKSSWPEVYTGDGMEYLVNFLDDARETLPKARPFHLDPETERKMNSRKDGDSIMEDKEPSFETKLSFPSNATEKDMKGIPTKALIEYVLAKKQVFDEKLPLDKMTNMKRKEVIKMAKKYAKTFDPNITKWDTDEFLLNHSKDEMSHFPIKDLQQHLLNSNGDDLDVHTLNIDYIIQELCLVQQELKSKPKRVRKQSKLNAIDFAKKRDRDEAVKITQSLEDSVIDDLTFEKAHICIREHLLETGQYEVIKQLDGATVTILRQKIKAARDSLFKESKELSPIMENEHHSTLGLSPDIPDIDANLDDVTLNNLEEDALVKIFFKHCEKEGEVTNSIASLRLWSPEALRRSIKKKRDMPKSVLRSPQNKKSQRLPIRKVQSTIHSNAMNSWRYQMSYNLPAEFKGTEGLREYLGNILMEMKTYCSQVAILPWNTNDFLDKVTTADEIPKSITQLKNYFQNARSMHSGGWGFTKLRIGLPAAHDRATFETDIQEWAKGQNIRLYEATVQHHNTKPCGWLAYAPKSLNKKKWSNAVMRMYAQSFSTPGATITLGLSWRALNGQKNVDQKQKVYAMHVEAPADMCTTVKRYLRILSRKKVWPLGVKFRLMMDFNQYMKENNKDKHRYMVNKHQAFLQQILEGSCHQIISLDKKIPNTKVTVREIVTQIRDRVDGRRFFGSIDEHWRNSLEHTVTLRPDKRQKAHCFLKSLSTYVLFLHPLAELKGIFTMEAIDKAQKESYDYNTQEFQTEEDAEFLKVVQEDMDDDSLDFLEFDDDALQSIRLDLETSLPSVIGGDKTMDFQGDDDTITTASVGTTGSRVSFTKTTCFPEDNAEITERNEDKDLQPNKGVTELETTLKHSMKMLNDVKAAPDDKVAAKGP